MLENRFFIPLAQVVAPRPVPATNSASAPAASTSAPEAVTAPAAGTAPASAAGTAVATGPASTAAAVELTGVLSAPKEFKQIEQGANGVTITWQDADPNVAGFHVWRSDDGGATYKQLDAKPVRNANQWTLADNSLPEANKGYEYKIVAYNSTNQSDTLPGHAATSSSMFGSLTSLLPFAVLILAVYFFMIRGQRKDRRKREDMIKDLKKGDKIMTIGGMVARVVSIDGDDVVLKIDESNNIKATYRKSAIQEVLDRDEKK